MSRIAGQSSAGKTQIAISAAAKFHKKYPKGKIIYFDSECAFDVAYAYKLGLPEDKVEFKNASTLEEFGDQAIAFLKKLKKNEPALIVLDSLDAMITEDTKETEISNLSGYGGGRKAGVVGNVLQKLIPELEETDAHFLCICQTRDNMTGYGPKKKATGGGGNAPFFYSSQCVMLRMVEKLKKKVNKEDIIWGIKVEAYVDKNKCGTPFGKCQYTIIFNRGIDDIGSCLEFLHSKGQLNLLPPEILTDSIKSGSDDAEEDVPDDDDSVDEDGNPIKKKKGGAKWKLVVNRIAAIADQAKRREMVQAVKKATIDFMDATQTALDNSIVMLDDD